MKTSASAASSSTCGSTRNRKSSRRASRLAALLGAISLAGAAQDLPVFLADNHAETFGWIARTFDPDDPHVLVLVDAHSDASAAERSEELRDGLRRVPSLEARTARVEEWRTAGRLQAFNWIEPLMPRPVDRVRWLAAPELTEEKRHAATAEATGLLDGRLEVEPRSAGTFATRWDTCDLKGFHPWQPGARPVILAIDLDFFSGMTAEERARHFEAIWERAMDWPGLAGVAFAISRPWLTDDAEADGLLGLAADAVRRTRGARLEIDVSLHRGRDDSLKAEEYRTRGQAVPHWELSRTSPEARMRLVALGSRLTLRDPEISWNHLPDVWRGEYGTATLTPSAGEIDCDGVWRFPRGDEPVLRVNAPEGATGRVRWFALDPARVAYDLLPETGLGKEFSKSPGRRIYEKRRSLGTSEDFQLDPKAWRTEAGGRFRIEAEYETPHGWLPVPGIELCVRSAEGFRGALSECLGMPYAFGIAGVAEHDLSGVETGWGSDCSNLLIHAWRRNGLPLAWGDPGRLRGQLATKAENLTVDSGAAITAEEIGRGIAIDFGKHVAALWEDREPTGVLDGNDLAFHHLGGLPEIIELSKLAATRPTFALRVPKPATGVKIAFAGDVVLAGDERVAIDGFGRGAADLLLVNLEGIPSMRATEEKTRYDFRFPPERLGWLKQQGVDAVSLANNHAWDAGEDGFIEGLEALRKAGLPFTGGGRTKAEACRPWRVEKNGVKLAIFGVTGDDGGRKGEDDPAAPGIAGLRTQRDVLEQELARCRGNGERIIVLIHGGAEYSRRVSDEQRQWARWLVARGAEVVAGSGPHVIQREETHGGARILHSLGNAVYPKALKGADSGRIRVVELR
jgi:poly-gamma-glutamate capsule biosynthesis protein CapA/YwtB (metallophosphatase superfamily)